LKLDQNLVRALLEAFDKSDWLEMTVTIGNDRLHVSRRARRGGAPPPTTPLPSSERRVAEPAAAEIEAAESADAEVVHATPQPLTGTVVESPSVGLFWRSPSPGAPPFVEIGKHVTPGDTLAIVEVMKLMNHIVAPSPGVVRAILAENGERVEYGQPLFAIDSES
jgi:acetyl-CoA carboxylase biotin carboxyl carrier protein